MSRDAGGGQGVAFMLGSGDRRLLELVDALRVSRPHRQHTGEAGADHDIHLGFGRSGKHAAGHRLGLSRPAARQQRLDQLGGERIADRVGGIGDLQRSLQQPNRRRRRPRRRELRRPAQPPHRLGVAVLGPEGDVTRQPLDGYAGAPQHSTRLAVQALAHRRREILIDGVAYEVMAERETITRFGEQPGIHRRRERGNQLRRISAGEQPQLSQRERRAQDRGDPQQVQGVLGEQAQPAQECQAQGGWQRRRAGLGPPLPHVDRPLVVQRPYQLDHEQRVPPGTAHLLEQPRAGRKTDHLAGEVRRLLRAQRPKEHMLGAPRQEVDESPVDVHAMGSTAHRHEQRQRHTSQVTGDGVQRTQGQRIGPLQVLHDESDRDRRGELLQDIQDGLHDQPPLVGGARAATDTSGPAVGVHQTGQRGARGIRRAPLNLQRLTQGPQRTILLDLVARSPQDPETPKPGERHRLDDQTGLADPRLALQQRDPPPSHGGILDDGAEDIQLDHPADQPDPRTDAAYSHPTTIVGTPTGR